MLGELVKGAGLGVVTGVYCGFGYRNWYLEHVIFLEFFFLFSKFRFKLVFDSKGHVGIVTVTVSNGRLSDDVDKSVASYKKSPKAM